MARFVELTATYSSRNFQWADDRTKPIWVNPELVDYVCENHFGKTTVRCGQTDHDVKGSVAEVLAKLRG